MALWPLLLPSFVVATLGGTSEASASDASTTTAGPRRRLSASVDGYYFYQPAGADSMLGIGSVDVGRAHVEARYNYEGLRTGSAFLGPRFDVVLLRRLKLTITPMLGMVLGRTSGVAPGLEVDATIWKLELRSESEYVLDGSATDLSFFYSWSELSFRPAPWVRGGLVAQRARFGGGAKIIEHGLVVGLTLGALDLSAYTFDPFGAGRYYAFAIGVSL